MLIVCTAFPMISSGCGITGPCVDIAASIIRKCSRCSASSIAFALNAASMSTVTIPTIFRMVSRRPFVTARLQLDDDGPAFKAPQDGQPEGHEAERPQQ